MATSDATAKPALPSGLVAFVKRECPTCVLVADVLAEVAAKTKLTVYTQDDLSFPAGLSPQDDTGLARSWHYQIETVPTLLRVEDGQETARVVGWQRGEWEQITSVRGLGAGLPEWRPGCGSLSVDPDRVDALRVKFTGSKLHARRIELAALEDEMEAFFARGWTDGLPVVPPTEARVLAMLEGTTRAPQEVVAVAPPDLVECTVEKIAINAVMAGCKPEYLPVVIAAVEAACNDQFNIHGVLATTMPVGPVVVVNGPIRKALGMNAGKNVFGQGNRANSTIGRALQLVIRNVGGGRPGEVDRATFGNPGKLSFCFPEDEEGSPWGPLSADLGATAGASTVTLFPGEGPRSVVDQLSRDPESISRTFALCLRAVHHPKLVLGFDAILAIGPEHARIYREAGWTKQRVGERVNELTRASGHELARGAGAIAEGVPFSGPALDAEYPKFRPNNGLLIVHCGGGAGLFSAVIGGWANGAMGSTPVWREIKA